jgi:branched-chain amino acid transport system ATP-binding protein
VQQVYELFPRLHERRTTQGGSLSGGERQMLAVGRALRMAPKALLLDEPSIGLAPRFVTLLLRTVRTLVDAGLTVLLVEQNVRAAMEVSDVVHLLESGKLIASGSVEEMRNDPRIIEAYLGGSHG